MRRFPARRVKNYAWFTSQFVLTYNDATVGTANLLDGSQLITGVQQQQRVFNIKRIILAQSFCVAADDLADPDFNGGTWGMITWSLGIYDIDDTSVTDPITTDIDDETILAAGRTGLIGVTAQPEPPTGYSNPQTALPTGFYDFRDISTNRKFGGDQRLTIDGTRDSQASYNKNPNRDMVQVVHARILVQYPT